MANIDHDDGDNSEEKISSFPVRSQYLPVEREILCTNISPQAEKKGKYS